MLELNDIFSLYQNCRGTVINLPFTTKAECDLLRLRDCRNRWWGGCHVAVVAIWFWQQCWVIYGDIDEWTIGRCRDGLISCTEFRCRRF